VRDLPDQGDRARGQVNARPDGVGVCVLAQRHQAQDRYREAGLAQPEGLRDVHDAQPVRPARDGSRSGLGDAVPVPVGLDDGHDQAAVHPPPQGRHVAGDRGQVDRRLSVVGVRGPVHDHQVCQLAAPDRPWPRSPRPVIMP
jgi:hypothetical protein